MRKILAAATILLAAGAPIALLAQHDHAAHAGKASDRAASDQALAAAVAAEWRGEDKARDQFRHPAETLRFFRIEPGMSVLDYAPGTWYAKILLPYLGAQGTYVGAVRTLPFATPQQQEGQRTFPVTYPQQMANLVAQAGVTGTAQVKAINTTAVPAEMAGTLDRVLVFRMMHNIQRWGVAHDELKNFRMLLKDDGLLGIVQHRAKPDAPYSYADGNNGYLREEDLIKLIEAHGFELIDRSEVNANPKDPANHVGGVWQIPPSWASRDETLKAIGESDRMTLLFRKRP